jgi:GT2 family glycosyltransferase
MSLSILIVNWNSKDYLRKCLQTVQSTCADLSPQVVVVDGGSFDGCGEMLAAEFPETEFIQSRENLGFGKSNNLGFERISGDVLLLLNPDTELTPGAVQEMLAALERLPKPGIIGVRLHRSDGVLQTSCVQRLPTPLVEFLSADVLQKAFSKAPIWGTREAFNAMAPVEVESVTGACMLMYSATFRAVGGFSKQYFMYGEDLDLCFKVRRLGLKIYHIPTIAIMHYGGASTGGEFNKFSAILMRESVYLYMKANRGLVDAMNYRILMALSSTIRLTLLAATCLLSCPPPKTAQLNYIRKWLAILRWSVGLEKWVGKHTFSR